jgi:hypothetical protein
MAPLGQEAFNPAQIENQVRKPSDKGQNKKGRHCSDLRQLEKNHLNRRKVV